MDDGYLEKVIVVLEDWRSEQMACYEHNIEVENREVMMLNRSAITTLDRVLCLLQNHKEEIQR